jgi:IS30 family transposase
MITREEDIDARALHCQGWTISAIARHLGRDRKTIRAYLRGDREAGVRAPAAADRFGPFAVYCRARRKMRAACCTPSSVTRPRRNPR